MGGFFIFTKLRIKTNNMVTAPKLSNCLIQSIIFRLRFKNSKIKMYWNKRYKTFSFYVVINKTHEMRFKFNRRGSFNTRFLFVGTNVIKKI